MISGSSVTRQSLICDQASDATATALTYTLQGGRSEAHLPPTALGLLLCPGA